VKDDGAMVAGTVFYEGSRYWFCLAQ